MRATFPQHVESERFQTAKLTLEQTLGHWLWCQSIGHLWFPISLPLQHEWLVHHQRCDHRGYRNVCIIIIIVCNEKYTCDWFQDSLWHWFVSVTSDFKASRDLVARLSCHPSGMNLLLKSSCHQLMMSVGCCLLHVGENRNWTCYMVTGCELIVSLRHPGYSHE